MTLTGLVSRQNLSSIAFFIDGGSSISYELLHSEIQRYASKITKGALVFLLGSNDLASVIFYLACLEKKAVPLLLAKDISHDALHKLMQAYKPNYLFKAQTNDMPLDGYHSSWEDSG